MSATKVCSTALLETTKGTAAKVIGRCKAKSPKEVLWNPLDIECVPVGTKGEGERNGLMFSNAFAFVGRP